MTETSKAARDLIRGDQIVLADGSIGTVEGIAPAGFVESADRQPTLCVEWISEDGTKRDAIVSGSAQVRTDPEEVQA